MTEKSPQPSDRAAIPAAVQSFFDWLGEQGFVLAEERRDDFSFGDRQMRWCRDDVKIQFSLDRGRWFVDVVPGWKDGWIGYGLEIIVDSLDDARHFTFLLTRSEAFEILRNRLPEISELLATPGSCEEVEARRRQRSRRWFGA